MIPFIKQGAYDCVFPGFHCSNLFLTMKGKGDLHSKEGVFQVLIVFFG